METSASEPDVSAPPPVHALRTLSAPAEAITVHGTILRTGCRPRYRDGTEQTVYTGVLADDTGRIRFRAPATFPADRGSRVGLQGVDVTRTPNGIQLVISEETAVILYGTPSPPGPIAPQPLAGLRVGDPAVSVTGEILHAESVRVEAGDGRRRIRRGVIGDHSARLFVTDWCDRPVLHEGATVEIQNAYVERFRGVPTINLSQYSAVSRRSPSLSLPSRPPTEPIRAAVESDGRADIAVAGTVIDLQEGTGAIARCPHCGRWIKRDRCREHGEVDPEAHLRTKAVLDDGTAALTVVLNGSITASIYGGGREGARKEAHRRMHHSVRDRIADAILGRPCRVRGRLGMGEYGPTLRATMFEPEGASPAARSQDVLGRIK